VAAPGPLTKACFAEPNPAPLKAALARQGWLRDELLAPMQPASQATRQWVLELVSRR
jgi:4-hydroxy-tetrahydrodipicolinate synthase